MFELNLSPVRSDAPLQVVAESDALIVNGERFDFAPLPEGGELPAAALPAEIFCSSSNVARLGGVLHLTLILPCGPNPSPAVAFPEPVSVTGDGPVALPFDPPPAPPEDPEELPA